MIFSQSDPPSSERMIGGISVLIGTDRKRLLNDLNPTKNSGTVCMLVSREKSAIANAAVEAVIIVAQLRATTADLRGAELASTHHYYLVLVD